MRMYQKRGHASAGDNIELGEHFVKYMYEGNPVILKPKNICVLKAMFITKYEGGGGTTYIDRDLYEPQNRKYGGDLFAVLVGRDEPFPEVVNLSGYNYDLEKIYQLAETEGSQFSSAPWLNVMHRLERGMSRHSESTNYLFVNECTYVNQIMWRATRRNMDPFTG